MNPRQQSPLVSIVIPCFNYGRFLGEAIDSALGQTYRPIEVIVMDDGSTDNTPAVAASYGSAIRYIRNPNQGVYSTRQASLSLIQGDFFLNLDADNRLHPNFISHALDRLNASQDPHCAFVYTQRTYFGDASGQSKFPAYDLALLKRKNYIDMGSLIKADIVRRFGFDPAFNEGYGDYDFFLTLAENGYRGVLLDEPVIYYRVHGASITSSVSKTHRQVAIIKRLLDKHNALYSPAERKQALRAARERILLAIVNSRTPHRPFMERFADLGHLLGTPAGIAQIWEQVKYTIAPARYPDHSSSRKVHL